MSTPGAAATSRAQHTILVAHLDAGHKRRKKTKKAIRSRTALPTPPALTCQSPAAKMNTISRCEATPEDLSWGPIEHLAHYSCDSSANVTFDLSCLRVFKRPTALPFDLTQGRQMFYVNNEHNRSYGHPIPLDSLSRACVALGQEEKLRNAHVVTWRGVLVKLMLGIPIDLRFYAVAGVLHVLLYDHVPNVTHASQLLTGYHGYAFESLCTPSTDTDTDTFEVPSLDVWKCIVRRQFGDLNIVFGGEVDCAKREYDGTSDCLMELKTEQIGAKARPSKYKKWVLQSWLMGITEICVGYRDSYNQLQRVDFLPLEEMYTFAPGTLDISYRSCYKVLQELRAFCSTRGAEVEGADNAWMVSVKKGVLLGEPRMI
ncbi:hypothetical protein BDW22DRAFT_1425008 [Trametopsis cervina]|nr:hypothetical protein BDW22DRAFT_1425008 [Trametopsis cervina]